MSNIALETPQSTLRWLPRSLSPSEGLRGRICPQWRMLPGLIVLASSIVGIVCALIWECPYLCIAFGSGTIASFYLIYLGYNYIHLQTFQENNEIMRGSLSELEKQNQELEKQVLEFEKQNEILRRSASELKNLCESLGKENFNLQESNKQLKNTVSDLEELKKTLQEKANLHVENLQGLEKSLEGINTSTTQNHETLGNHIEALKNEIHRLQDTRSKFEQTGTEVEKKMLLQLDTLLKSAGLLEKIFTEIDKWKDKEGLTERIKLQQEQAKIVHQLELQSNTLKSNIESQQEKLETQKEMLTDLKQDIEELKELKKGFGVALNNLISEIEKLKGVNAEMVLKAAEVFHKHELKN